MSAVAGSSSSGDRVNKRLKGDNGSNINGPPPPPDGGFHPGYGQMPPQQRYGHPPYVGPSPPPPGHPMPQGGYGMWQNHQYGNQPPPHPHSWQHSQHPGMYPQRGGPPPMGAEMGGSGWSGYSRAPPPQQPPMGQGRRNKQNSPSRSMAKSPAEGTASATADAPPPPQQYQGWGTPQQQQWPQNQWGGAPPPMWQGAPPPPPPPPMHQQPMYGNQKMWNGGNSGTPPRAGQGRPRASPEVMGNGMMGPGGYAPQPGVTCQPVGMEGGPSSDMDMYVTSRSVGPPHEDDGSKSGGASGGIGKDKGRGSYKCGRCGVPKKGHVCPYQPKLKRRPGEPAPETRNAAVQVEVDEFMTLRRLNIQIQGFPESYASEPYMSDDMVGREAMNVGAPSALPPNPLPHDDLGLPMDDGGHRGGPPDHTESASIRGSPIPTPSQDTEVKHPGEASGRKR